MAHAVGAGQAAALRRDRPVDRSSVGHLARVDRQEGRRRLPLRVRHGTGLDWKVSHHNNWKWRIAMTKVRAKAGGIERVVIVGWRDRPERGWSEGAGLLVPCTYLRPASEPLPQSVVQVPTSPSHSCVRVRLLFEEPGAIGVRFGRGFPIGVLNRLGGGRVYVLADPISVSTRTEREMAAVCDEARAARSPNEIYPTSRFVWVIRLGNQPVQVDLSVD